MLHEVIDQFQIVSRLNAARKGEWLSHLHNAKRERCILVRGGDVGRETRSYHCDLN